MVKEKIYDIKPRTKKRLASELPKQVPAIKRGVLALTKKKVAKGSGDAKAKFSLLKGRGIKIKKLWLIMPGALLIVLAILLQLSAKAEIKIWPYERSLSLEKEVLIDINVDKSRFSNGVVMAKKISQQSELSKSFVATGSATEDFKAEGKIKVVNDYHLAQILVKKTRFLSADGKLFYLQGDVSIPAGTSLEVGVEAAEPGPDYNIKATTFSIPGLLGSPRYTFVYAESFSAMSGGAKKTVAQVTKADLETAEEATSQALKQQLEGSLKDQAGTAFFLLPEAVESQILDKSFSQEAGDKKASFDCSLAMTAEGIAWQNQDFDELMEYFVLQEINEDEEIKKESLLVIPEVKTLTLTDGKLRLNVKISATILKSIDGYNLKKALSGKSIKESELFLASDPTIREAEVRFFPFWLIKIPQDLERIEINLVND